MRQAARPVAIYNREDAVKISTNRGAGLLYLMPVVAVAGAWVLLLVVHNPTPSKPLEVLWFILAENPSLLWLRWFLAVPVIYVALSAAYVTPLARGRAGAILLLVLGTVAAVTCWVAFDPWFGVVATVPLVASYQSVREKFIAA